MRLMAMLLAASACVSAAAMAQELEQFDLPPLEEPFGSFQSLEQPAQDVPPPMELPAEAMPPAEPAKPERMQNKVAEFSGIDKITGRITSFDVYVGETVQFGALQVTPRICYTSPPTEPPQTDSFVEVDEITLDREIRRIFTGWMFSDSPGLNAVEHPVYDVWLKSCKTDSAVPPPAG